MKERRNDTNEHTSNRRTGARRTAVRPGDQRITGTYEQTADYPDAASACRHAAMWADRNDAIDVHGRVRATRLSYDDLIDLARVQRDKTFGVPMVDLCAEIGLHVDADVVVFGQLAGESLVVPVRDVLNTVGAQLTLGTHRRALSFRDGFPVRLDIPGWTNDLDPTRVCSVRAATFEEFIGCRR